MTIFVYLSIIIINLLIALKIKKKNNFLLYYISLFLMILLVIGYRNTSGFSNDLMNYEIEYNNFLLGFSSNYEVGYVLLMTMGSYFTNDFYIFKSTVSGILLIFLFNNIRKYSPNPHFIISFFSIYLLILSAEQFRYFIGFTIFSIGLTQLIFSEKKYKKIKFTILTLFASTMHISFLVYLLFLIINLKNKNIKKELFIGIFGLLFSVIVFLNGNKIPGVNSFIREFETEKISIYFNQSTNFGFLYVVILQAINILLSYFLYKFCTKNENDKNKKITSIIFKINILSTLFFPLIMTQITFYRLIRNLLIINYFAVGILFNNVQVPKLGKALYLFSTVFSIFLWIYFDLIIKTPAKALLIPFFEENIYFNF